MTVVDLTVNLAGPFASMVLSDLGARVIKIEPPYGDDARVWPPVVGQTGTVFIALNRGKESVAIDAKTPAGRELICRLVERADVFMESLRPGKAAALGLDWEDLRSINPGIVYCSINAFGDVGPLARAAGFDAIVQAYSGIMDLTGYPDGDPCRVGAGVIDVGTGMWAVINVLAALLEPDPDRRGGRVQTTLLGTAVGFVMHHLAAARLAGAVPRRMGTAQHNFAPYQAIHASDAMVMVGVNSDRMWRRFCDAIGAAALAQERRYATTAGRIANRAEMIRRIEEVTCQMTSVELVDSLTTEGVPASAVRPVTALLDDPQVAALELWGQTPEGHVLPRVPVPAAAHDLGRVPRLGEHTESVLRELGLESTEIERLAEVATIITSKSLAVKAPI
jgi:CoA:oxalate CoA-transferase